jgi:hypothetical protein
MTTYADPTRCPDCHAVLPAAPATCARCALPLTGPTAVELFSTLQRADRLLGDLRRQAVPVEEPVRVGVGTGSPLAGAAPYPSYQPLREETPGLRGSSVPRILLTLGALCLLVAAVTFLAVAWSWLGVGGRTLVLVALTATTLGLTGVLLRRGLRMAAEALSVVGLGLVALDVVGVRHAGWLGDLTDAHLVLLTGCAVATAGLVVLLASAPRPLVAPGLIVPLAVLAAGVGAQVNTDHPAPLLVTVLALLGLARVGTSVPSEPLRWASLAMACVAWLYAVAFGLALATGDQTVTHLWGHGALWPLVVATALAAAAGPAVGGARAATLAGAAAAAVLGTVVVVLPALDNSPTAATLSLLPCVLLWAATVAAGPARFRIAAVVPLASSAVLPVAAFLSLVAAAARASLDVGDPFTQDAGVHVAQVDTWVAPGLPALILVTLAVAGCAVVGATRPLRRSTWAGALGAAVVLGVAVALPLYDVPLAAVVGLLLAAACVAFVLAERLPGARAAVVRCVAALLAALAVLVALPSDVLTAAVLAVVTAGCALLMRRTDLTGDLATVAFSFAFGGLMWSAGSAWSVPEVDRALPVLLVLGLLAIWRPEPVLEVSAVAVGTLASLAAVLAATDVPVALAVHLTVAGALVTTSAILHPSRRELAWAGGLLLAAATWVRLADLGVHVVEAYTLPSALVLLAVGVWRLRHDDRSATLRVVAPGLTLATVPSLLVALGDPVSLRALLLGLACLALVLAGVAARWAAPLVVGGAVGATLVLRELAPYAAQLPPWLVIGLSGTLLTAVGVTWESRMRDVRTASHYVAGLR